MWKSLCSSWNQLPDQPVQDKMKTKWSIWKAREFQLLRNLSRRLYVAIAAPAENATGVLVLKSSQCQHCMSASWWIMVSGSDSAMQWYDEGPYLQPVQPLRIHPDAIALAFLWYASVIWSTILPNILWEKKNITFLPPLPSCLGSHPRLTSLKYKCFML